MNDICSFRSCAIEFHFTDLQVLSITLKASLSNPSFPLFINNILNLGGFWGDINGKHKNKYKLRGTNKFAIFKMIFSPFNWICYRVPWKPHPRFNYARFSKTLQLYKQKLVESCEYLSMCHTHKFMCYLETEKLSILSHFLNIKQYLYIRKSIPWKRPFWWYKLCKKLHWLLLSVGNPNDSISLIFL